MIYSRKFKLLGCHPYEEKKNTLCVVCKIIFIIYFISEYHILTIYFEYIWFRKNGFRLNVCWYLLLWELQIQSTTIIWRANRYKKTFAPFKLPPLYQPLPWLILYHNDITFHFRAASLTFSPFQEKPRSTKISCHVPFLYRFSFVVYLEIESKFIELKKVTERVLLSSTVSWLTISLCFAFKIIYYSLLK